MVRLFPKGRKNRSSLISGGRKVAIKTEFIDYILEVGQWIHHK